MKPLLKDASEADKAQWIPRKLLKPENLHRSPHSQETFIAENTNTSIQTLNHIYICRCSAGTLGRSLHPLGVQEDAQGKEGEEERKPKKRNCSQSRRRRAQDQSLAEV